MFSLFQPLKKSVCSFGLALLALVLSTQNALADGIFIPDPPPIDNPVTLEESWLTIRYHRVSVLIEDQIAVTRVEQEFLNELDWEVEGTYVFPLPEGAAISEFVLWVDGEPVEAKILEADQARQIYENIVRERRDPALLEYVGKGAVQARIYPIPPGGSRKVELEYSQVLQMDNGLIKYSYPLNTEKFSAQPLEDCSVRIELNSRQPLRSIYSPTHQDRIYLNRDGEFQAVVSYEENYVLPDQDFELIYTLSKEDVALNLLTYPDPGGYFGSEQTGYFLLMAAPAVEVDQIIPRDIVLVLDTSGSMEGDKLDQAKMAAGYVLTHLNQEDTFNVIAFSTGVQHFSRQLQPVSQVSQAIAWIDRMQALGGTNINLALLEAMAQRNLEREGGSDRQLVILFLTDGLPTEGVTDIDQILANAKASASNRIRMFAFGVGDDVNTELLDTLSQDNRGLVSYVRPSERIDEEVSALFARIKSPVLANLELDFGGILVEDVYPPVLPDLFSGTQLLIAGRYRLPAGSGNKTTISLTGSVNSHQETFVYQANFDPGERTEGANSFIPRLWAARKIGYLLNQIRYQGENKEWVDAVIQLSIRYGIITPYTSFLVVEENIFSREGWDEAAQELMEEYAGPAVGAEAVDKAEAEANLRSAESVPQPVVTGDSYLTDPNQPVLKYVGEKTFFFQGGVWIDSTFDSDSMNTLQIGFGTSVYYELLSARPEWGKYLALGENVIFVIDGKAYEILPGEGELNELPAHLSLPENQSSSQNNDQRIRDQVVRPFCAAPLLLGVVLTSLGGKARV